MNINQILYLIKNSNLKTTTKSFLASVLKDVENADPEKIKAEEDAAWSQRAQQKDAKKQLEEDAAYDTFESSNAFKTYPSFEHKTSSRMTPEPDAVRPADESDVEKLRRKVAQRQEVLATPGRVDPKIAKLEQDKINFMQQADDMYDDVSGKYLQDEIAQAPGDPRFSDYILDGGDPAADKRAFDAELKESVRRQELEDLFDLIGNDFNAIDQTRTPTGFNPKG
jgi:hypothetical protein